MSAGAAIELLDLTHAYTPGAPTVSHLSLSIAAGEFFTLLGASGCGKTTTLRLVAGLLTPTAGRILVDGQDITSLPTHKREIGVVFQNYALFPHMRVADNVAYGLRTRRWPAREIGPAVAAALATVGLPGLGDRYPSELSGGQQQRVGLARAIAVQPKVMLLDEPLSNLDVKLREQMCVEIGDLQRRLGITLLYVTHDQAEALAVSDRIGVMQGGRIQEIGTPTEIYRRPRTEAAARFLGDINMVRLKVGAGGFALPSGRPLAIAAASSAHLAELTVAIRPEAVNLSPAPGAPNRFAARVIRSIYRGASSLVHLQAADFAEPLIAMVLGSTDHAPGDELFLSIPPAQIHAVGIPTP